MRTYFDPRWVLKTNKNAAASVFSWISTVNVTSEIGSRENTLKPLKLDHIIRESVEFLFIWSICCGIKHPKRSVSQHLCVLMKCFCVNPKSRGCSRSSAAAAAPARACVCMCARESARLHSSLYCTMSRYNLFMRSWGWRCSVGRKRGSFSLSCLLSFFRSFVRSFVLSFSLFFFVTHPFIALPSWLTSPRMRDSINGASRDRARLGWVTTVLRSMMNEIYEGFFNEGHLIYTNNALANVTFHFKKLGKENKWNV